MAEPVAEQVQSVSDLLALVTRADINSEAAQECIEKLRENDRFFSTDAHEQMRTQLDRESERQGLANQEGVFAEERQRLERDLVQTLAPGGESTLQEVDDTVASLAGVEEQLIQNPAERFALEEQTLVLNADLEHYVCLAGVVEKALDQQEGVAMQQRLHGLFRCYPYC